MTIALRASLHWEHWTVIASVCVLVFALFYIKRDANHNLDKLLWTDFDQGKSSMGDLVVVVHAYMGDIQSMAAVRRIIRQSQPNADILLFGYPAQMFSNADPCKIADQMCEKIQNFFDKKSYEHIRLVGYSMGALLARKAYLYGCGHIEDVNPYPNSRTGDTSALGMDPTRRPICPARWYESWLDDQPKA